MSILSPSDVAQPGVRYARREDHRLITGTGAFTDDLRPDQMLHGHVIRSPHAHARIRSMRQAPAAPAMNETTLGVTIAAGHANAKPATSAAVACG